MGFDPNRPIINSDKHVFRLSFNRHEEEYLRVAADLSEAGMPSTHTTITDALWAMGGRRVRGMDQPVSSYGEWRQSIGLPFDPNTVLPPPIPDNRARKLEGVLRIDRQGSTDVRFIDDRGPVLPVFAHAGDLFSLWKRDREWARAEMRDLASAGWMGIRTWAILGGDYWTSKGRDTNEDGLGEFVADAFDGFGLRTMLSMGDMPRLRPSNTWAVVMDDVARQLHDAGVPPEAVASVDGGNESWNQTSFSKAQWDMMGAAVKVFNDVFPVAVRSITDSPEGDLWKYHRPIANVFDVHGWRGGFLSDKIRHVFSILWHYRVRGADMPARLGIQSEPPGAYSAGSLESVTQNRYQMNGSGVLLLALMHLIFRQWHVWFSSPGVSIRRRGEFAEQHGFASIPQVAATLPSGIMGWRRIGHGGDNGNPVWEADDRENYLRCDYAEQTHGDKIAVVSYRQHGDAMTVSRRDMRGSFLNLRSGTWGPEEFIPAGAPFKCIPFDAPGSVFIGTKEG